MVKDWLAVKLLTKPVELVTVEKKQGRPKTG